MYSKRIQLGLSACAWFLLVSVYCASGLQPILPPPPPTPTPPVVIEPPPPTPSVNPNESFPVVISYGQGQETRVQLHRGFMDPVGLLPNQVVKVTISFPTSMAGAPVLLGLYDGGQAGPAALPGSDMINSRVLPVSVNGSLQFNFQAGSTSGLYRALMTVGNDQYLLRFYAGQPHLPRIPRPGQP